MDHIPLDEFPIVGEASHSVVREAKAAGVWNLDADYGVNKQRLLT
jgi:hypothetical protein